MNVIMDKPTNAGSSKAEYLGAAEKARRDVGQGRRLGILNVYIELLMELNFDIWSSGNIIM